MFDWHIYICLWSIRKFKSRSSTLPMRIICNWRLTGWTLQFPSSSKSCISFRLTYLHLTLAHSKAQGQGHPHFDCEYLYQWWQIWQTLLLSSNSMSCLGFRFAYLHFTLDHSKGQGEGRAHFYCKHLVNWMVTDMANTTIAII